MKFLQSILSGIGQVMFQNNSFSGVLFLIGICYNSWLLGWAALLGTVISTGFAHFSRYSKEDVQNGLYGFNGTLTGIAVLCFFELSVVSVIVLIVGAVLSAVLMNVLKRKLPPFTAPFVITTWLIITVLLFVMNVPLLALAKETFPALDLIKAAGNSFGQVMFQENVITGFFFFMGILINNRRAAAFALYAVIVSVALGWLTEPVSSINAGLMGYNAILCAMALAGKRKNDFLWVSLAIILSTWVTIGLGKTGIIVLTAPFVLVTWGILWFKNIILRKEQAQVIIKK